MALEPLILTVDVTATSDVVTVADATVLTPSNCRPGAAVFIGGVGGFVKALLTTTTFQLSRPWDGVTSAGVGCEIAPFTAEMASRAELSQQLTTYDARLVLFEAYRRGFVNFFSTSVDLSNPGTGHAGLNSLTPADATAMVISDQDANGQPQNARFLELSRGDTLTLRTVDTGTVAVYKLTLAPTAETGFTKILDLTYVEGSGTFSADAKFTIEVNNVSEGLDVSAQVADIAGRAAYDSEAAGFRVLVDDTGSGRAGVYTLVTPGGSPVWAGPAFIDGPKGDTGEKGWSPRHALVVDGTRRVLQLADYVGGTGDAPTSNIGKYVGAAGYEADIANGIDVRGTQGLPIGHRLTFSTNITEGDPGAGKVKANDATFGSITTLWINDADADAINIEAWIGRFDDNVNASGRGFLKLRHETDTSVLMNFAVTGAVTDKTGYWEIPVSPVSGAIPANAAPLVGNFSNNGADGSDGGGLKGISIRAASTTNIDLSTDLEAGDSAGGVTLVAGNAFGAFGQTDARENGIYVVQASGAAVRHTSFDTWDEIAGGLFPVREGDFAGSTFVNTDAAGGGTIDTDDLTFVEQSGGGEDMLSFYSTLALEQAEDRSGGPVFAGPSGNGVFDGLNVSDYVDVAGATNLTIGGGLLYPADVTPEIATMPLNANSVGWSNYNIRIRIAAAQISEGGLGLRFTLTGPTSGSQTSIDAMWVGHAADSGDAYDFDGTQVRIKASGSNSFNVPVAGTLVTDFVDYAVEADKDLIISAHISSGDLRRKNTATGDFGLFEKAGASEAATSNVSGYTTSSADYALISNVETYYKGDLEVSSTAISLINSPKIGRIYAFINENGATINADCVLEISRDGIDYKSVSLAEMYERADGVTVFSTGPVDLSDIDPGTSARWRLTTNSKANPRLHAIGVMFGDA